MDRTLRVKGIGKLSVKPDLIQLLLTLKGLLYTYGQALEEASAARDRLKEAFTERGFTDQDLKTSYFSIDTKYEGQSDGAGNYQQKFVGFEYEHRLKLEFEADNKRLGQILTSLLNSGVPALFNIVYTVKDPGPIKAQLLERAVLDARTKAELLARAAGVRTGKLLRIIHSKQDPALRAELMRGGPALNQTVYAGLNAGLEPEDIQLEESVSLVWEIE
jgi:uncharacterized protein YggE